MATWERKRAPDEVPTPVAVALSDYCRRARSSASATEVRQALSLLSEDEDFRVSELADQEPEAQPLGPFAVVDVLSGTPPAVAATRQQSGYYDLARELVEERERGAPPPAPAVTEPAPAAKAEAAPAVWSEPHELEKPRKRAEKEKPLTLAEKIAPKKRLEPAPKRELPAPRGRFTRVEAVRRPAGELFSDESKAFLEGMVGQHPHRFALTRALAASYSGRAGLLGQADVLDALEKHGLLAAVERKEKELVLASFAEHRGATGRVAWALSLNPTDVGKLVEALDLARQVEEVRERFRREALDARNLGARLDLIGRSKYLADLGIEKRFTESLRGELRAKLSACVEHATSITQLFELAGKRNAVSPELLSRAADRLKLTEDLERKLRRGSSPHASS